MPSRLSGHCAGETGTNGLVQKAQANPTDNLLDGARGFVQHGTDALPVLIGAA